jgi:hypothetical protein
MISRLHATIIRDLTHSPPTFALFAQYPVLETRSLHQGPQKNLAAQRGRSSQFAVTPNSFCHPDPAIRHDSLDERWRCNQTKPGQGPRRRGKQTREGNEVLSLTSSSASSGQVRDQLDSPANYLAEAHIAKISDWPLCG